MGHLTALRRHRRLTTPPRSGRSARRSPRCAWTSSASSPRSATSETKLAGFDLPDPIAMAYAIDPAVATETRRVYCAVECDSTLTRGMVVMDLLGLSGTDAERHGGHRGRPVAVPGDAARRGPFCRRIAEQVDLDDRTAQTASSHHSLYCGSSPRTARA